MPAEPIQESAGPDVEQDAVHKAVEADTGIIPAESTGQGDVTDHATQDVILSVEDESAVDAEQAAIEQAVLSSMESGPTAKP